MVASASSLPVAASGLGSMVPAPGRGRSREHGEHLPLLSGRQERKVCHCPHPAQRALLPLLSSPLPSARFAVCSSCTCPACSGAPSQDPSLPTRHSSWPVFCFPHQNMSFLKAGSSLRFHFFLETCLFSGRVPDTQEGLNEGSRGERCIDSLCDWFQAPGLPRTEARGDGAACVSGWPGSSGAVGPSAGQQVPGRPW